jgi:1-acyl-sn-glycerol-3-phosphate acyltransferase
MLIYPEGTQSNGDYILPFKRGAFAGMKTVRPFCIKYNSENMIYKPQWDCVPFLSHAFMLLCNLPFSVTVTVLPPFKPNKYLLDTHKDKGKTDWEIFAWATRHAMCKAGDFKTIDADVKDKQLYKSFMSGKIDEIKAPNGVVYKAEPMRKKKD